MAFTKDPTHPDFPHGQQKGWYRGCRSDECPVTPSCRTVRLRAQKASRVGMAQPRWVSAQMVRDHVTGLMDQHPQLTIAAVARAAGVHPPKLTAVMRSGQPGVARHIAAAVLAVTAHAALRRTSRVDAREARHTINTLRALGYPMRWQSRRCGIAREFIEDIAAGRWATVSRADNKRLRDLAATVGDRAANPGRDGIEPKIITRTVARARRDGWHPPACYDDNGDLIPEAVPGHPWAIALTHARNRIDAIRDSLDGHSAKVIAARYGLSERSVMRYRRLAGTSNLADQERIAAWRQIIDQVDRGDLDPLAVVLEHGLLDDSMVPKDHPVLMQRQERGKVALAA